MGGRYSFLHALYQQGLYERRTETRRVRLHRRIGEQKTMAYGERAREIASELAIHFAAGRDFQRAVRFLPSAAENAVRRHAHQEAVGHVRKALVLLQSLPDTPERVQQELTLQVTLGEQLTSLQGFGVTEVEEAFARARALCRQLGDTPQLSRVILGLWAFYVERAELTTAYELAGQLLRIAQQVQAAGLLVWAHLTLGITHHFAGEQISARQHLEECLSRYDSQQFRNTGSPYDPAVLGLSTLGPVLWLLGYPDQALVRGQKGLALARELTQQYSVVYALTLATRTRLLRRERQAVQAGIDELITLCKEQGFTSYLALSRIVHGWLLTEEGQEEGIEQMCQQLCAWRATGAESARPYYLALLAETYGKAGASVEGLAVLTECCRGWIQQGDAFLRLNSIVSKVS
jgi:predicted ATPase